MILLALNELSCLRKNFLSFKLRKSIKEVLFETEFIKKMEFECEYSFTDWFNGIKYTCNVSKVSIIEPETRMATFKGIHEAGKTNMDVEGLCIADTNVEYFPNGLEKIFPRLTNVLVINCGLKEISRKDFEGLGHLEELSLSNNELKSLPNDLFVDTPKLQSIYLQYNKIERLNSKILDPLDKKNLKVFWLVKNPSISMNFQKGGATTLEAFINEIDAKCLPPIEEPLIEPRQPPIKPESRFQKYEEYFVSGKFSDFTIKVRNKEYKVHKMVLSAQSSKFDSMFNEDDGDSLKFLEKIKIMSEDAFEDFLRYFYFGTIRSEDNAMELFGLAAEFDVTTLKFECEEIILRDLNELNSLEVLNFAHLHGSEVLKKAAFTTIKKTFPEISDNVIEAPEIIAELIKAKRHLDELMNAAKEFKICELPF